VFDALHRRDKEIDGEDLRPRPLSEREAKLLARAPAGVVLAHRREWRLNQIGRQHGQSVESHFSKTWFDPNIAALSRADFAQTHRDRLG
jgi:hypothetical protein